MSPRDRCRWRAAGRVPTCRFGAAERDGFAIGRPDRRRLFLRCVERDTSRRATRDVAHPDVPAGAVVTMRRHARAVRREVESAAVTLWPQGVARLPLAVHPDHPDARTARCRAVRQHARVRDRECRRIEDRRLHPVCDGNGAVGRLDGAYAGSGTVRPLSADEIRHRARCCRDRPGRHTRCACVRPWLGRRCRS